MNEMKNYDTLQAALGANRRLREMSAGEVVERVFGVFQSGKNQLYRVLHAKVIWSKQYADPLIMLFHLCENDQRVCIDNWLDEYIGRRKAHAEQHKTNIHK